jgi:hypothetical protein
MISFNILGITSPKGLDRVEIIELLVSICGHNTLQAHQCAVIIHNTGEYAVFEDKYYNCSDVYEELLGEGIDVALRKKT